MSTTVGTLSKDVEQVMSTLSPEELAKFIADEVNRIANNEGEGMNQDAGIAEVHRIYDRHVLTKDWSGYAKFWRAMDTEDIRHWANAYFAGILDGLIRQDGLIGLLLLKTSQGWLTDYTHQIRTGKKDPIIIERMVEDRETIVHFLARKQEITQTVKRILEADFWEEWKMKRPEIDLSLINEQDEVLTKVMAWMLQRDPQAVTAPSETSQKTRSPKRKHPAKAASPL